MKTLPHSSHHPKHKSQAAFTLMETVIAVGVLTVLLTGFIAVFTPATQGIRQSIGSAQADRLATTLETELVTLRSGQQTPNPTSGFDKAFQWIRIGNAAANAIFVYQYRGDPATIRADGTPAPVAATTGQPGVNYIVQSMARRLTDAELVNDLNAIEGSVFFVKPTQLVSSPTGMTLGTPGQITNPTPLPVRTPAYPAIPTISNDYADAVISFSAEFHSVPTKTITYLQSAAFTTRFSSTTTNQAVFTRNLAVRR